PRRGWYHAGQSPISFAPGDVAMTRRVLVIAALLLPLCVPLTSAQPDEQSPPPTREELLRDAVQALVKIQEDGGQWPYEGVYRVNKELPVGYRVGGTSIVATTLLVAAPADKDAQAAIGRGLEFVLKELDHPLMKLSVEN